MNKISGSRINTMVSDQFEIWHVEDQVTNEKAIYHYHDYYEIHATLSGEAEIFIEGEVFNLEPGTVLLIHSNDLHRILKQNSEYFERVYIFVTSAFLERHSTSLSNLEDAFASTPSEVHRSKVIKVPLEILQKQLNFVTYYLKPSKDIFGADIELENNLVNYIIHLNRWLQDSKLYEKVDRSVDPLMEEMIRYVSENLTHELTLEDMEKQFFLSKYHIIRAFKKRTGISFYQYVLKKRLLLSKQLLLKNNNVISVYSECGFASYTNYLRAFKKEFDMTPKEFIKKSRYNQHKINRM